MSNPTFYTIANAATGGADLLSALDDFLDMSCVLPPGEVSWDWVLFVGQQDRRGTRKGRYRIDLSPAENWVVPGRGIRPSASVRPTGLTQGELVLRGRGCHRPTASDTHQAWGGAILGYFVLGIWCAYFVNNAREPNISSAFFPELVESFPQFLKFIRNLFQCFTIVWAVLRLCKLRAGARYIFYKSPWVC